MSTAAATAPLRVVQITDCHLGAQAGTRQLNIDTDASLDAVLQQVRQRPCDVLLATGDLADNGSPAAYRRLLEHTADFPVARWLPGNHDSAALLRETLDGDPRLARTFAGEHWLIVMLDSAVPGEVGGHLAARELDDLRACLAAQPQRHVLICLHHPVAPVGTPWLDGQRVGNADAFWRVLAAFPQVRAVLCGHVHQPVDKTIAGVRVLASPSTGWQFTAGSVDFRIDTLAPGYRWLDLHADGRIDTGIERVADHLFSADVDSHGY